MNNKEKFALYEKLLRDWSTRMNLVAPSTLDDVENRHFADSAQLADILPHDVSVIDMGSGAGFPGVVLAILGWQVTCIESIGKKANFLNTLKQELELPNLTIYHGRLEDYIKTIKPGRGDIVFTARAFASLMKIFDYIYGIKSRLFLLKGREIGAEIAAAQSKYSFEYELIPSATGDGYIIRIEKIKLFHVK